MAVELLDLNYDYSELEPVISEQVLKWHHQTHHKGYVKGWKNAEEALQEQRQEDDFSSTGSILNNFTHNYCGTVLHDLFWKNMGPEGGGEPTGKLLQKIEEDFGSYENWKKEFQAAAKSASGWALLVYIPRTDQLHNVSVDKHDEKAVWGAHPVLALDVWEHSYYHDYGPDRAEFIDGFFDVVNWDYVEKNYSKIRGIFE